MDRKEKGTMLFRSLKLMFPFLFSSSVELPVGLTLVFSCKRYLLCGWTKYRTELA